MQILQTRFTGRFTNIKMGKPQQLGGLVDPAALEAKVIELKGKYQLENHSGIIYKKLVSGLTWTPDGSLKRETYPPDGLEGLEKFAEISLQGKPRAVKNADIEMGNWLQAKTDTFRYVPSKAELYFWPQQAKMFGLTNKRPS